MVRTWTRISLAVVLLAVLAGADETVTLAIPEPGSPGGAEEWSEKVAYLGVDVQDITAERVKALKLKEERGVEITMVDQDAPAGKVGLKEHDVVLEFNGARVEGTEQLRRMIRETPPGRTVSLGISRDGQPMTLSVQLADRSKALASKQKEFQYAMPKVRPIPPMPPIPSIDVMVHSYSRYGLVVDNLTPQLGEFFGVKNGEGVLVRSVEKGTPAEAAGFRAGDVIVRVDNERISDRGDWRSALRSHRSGKISVGIIRDKKEQTLSLTLAESKDKDQSFKFEMPDLDLDLDMDEIDMTEIQTALQHIQPEIQRASRQALEQGRRALGAAKVEVERQMKSCQKQMEKAKQELEKSLEEQ